MTDDRTHTTLNSIVGKSIPNGTKFVAIYGDGSGASLFAVNGSGHLVNANGETVDNAPDCYLTGAGFSFWIALPRSFEFWYKQKLKS